MEAFYEETFRHTLPVCIIYTFFYGSVFVSGLLGNLFVLLSVAYNIQLRTTTDYMISSLAMADLFIIVFCLPTTFINNMFLEWPLGNMACKLTTWLNSITSGASVFTLVAVTADRYLAICHTLKYTVWDSRMSFWVIGIAWALSGLLSLPQLFIYEQILYDYVTNEVVDPVNITSPATIYTICSPTMDETYVFIFFNLLLTFIVPFAMIIVMYIIIFKTISAHRSLAVDAHIRDERAKINAAKMMLTVIVGFAFCWSPLYGLHCYFIASIDGLSNEYAVTYMRPIFQWLSLMSSSFNPIIYVVYSHKYRRAFHQFLLLPCRARLGNIRRFKFYKTTATGEGNVGMIQHSKLDINTTTRTVTTICQGDDHESKKSLYVCAN
uniref:G_PROTEIN_RECEP_F1_2 domain-containing protein n=1 Tax=Rhabditophanes sp. KR3021 TaxID=114890 RepID=A0AC35TXV3_9BILA